MRRDGTRAGAGEPLSGVGVNARVPSLHTTSFTVPRGVPSSLAAPTAGVSQIPRPFLPMPSMPDSIGSVCPPLADPSNLCAPFVWPRAANSFLSISSARTPMLRNVIVSLKPLVSTPTNLERPNPKMLEFRSKDERNEMSAAAQTMLRDYAGLRWPTLNHKGRIARLAGALRMGHRRVRSLYQNEPGVSLRADEMAAIAALHEQKIEEANQHVFADLQARITRLEAALFAQDEEFHHEQVAAFRAAVDSGRGADVTGSIEREGE